MSEEQPTPKRPALATSRAVLMRENVRERHFDVDSNFDQWRLDRFLCARLARLSRTKANEIARYGDVEVVPPRRIKPAMKLNKGEVVILRERLEPEWVQDDQVDLLHIDERVIILNKPAGMLVHESASVRLNTIQWYLRRQGYEHAEPVHRLDRETSGVLVCARTPEMVPKLRDLFASDHPDKIYRALVHDPDGRWSPGDELEIDTPLGPVTGRELTVRMGEGKLRALTHVRALGHIEHPKFGRLSDLRVQIETGRQHQIRVHLEMAGTPIAGDKLYGQTDEFFMASCDRPDDPALLDQLAFPRHALHAWKLKMARPGNRRQSIEFTAPLPPRIWSAGELT